MPFYEVLFETGRSSVMNCETDDELKGFVTEQDRRARAGEPGGPIGQPAERIAKVYKYDKHPDDYNPDQTASADVVKSELTALVDDLTDENGVVSIAALAESVRALSHPMKQERTEPFESMYKMKEKGEVDLSYLDNSKGVK